MAMYLSHAVRLKLVLLLVDAKVGLKSSDRQMLETLSYYKKPVQVVFSKIDSIKGTSRNDLNSNLEKTARYLQIYNNVYPEIYLLSSKKFFGVKELRARIVLSF